MSDTTRIASQPLFPLTLASLGVVYGDIGTSPLYAMRESLDDLPITQFNILGTLSLIFWALILSVSLKYLIILFRADNDGEGGILALLALIKRVTHNRIRFLFVIGIFGAGLMLGDGMLTPAISVISAIEGFYIIIPSFSDWIIPLTCIILVSIFIVQSYGTERIGFIFGPIIFIWFVIIGVLGLRQILTNPTVLWAINPYYAWKFFQLNGWHGYNLLGGVFLVLTGGEALYADLGHFGKTPIRLSWFMVVLPGLLLNYFGQGAYLMAHPEGIVNPFYLLSPSWFSIPLLVLAAIATIIASQAVITATFSLTKQAMLLGLYPRVNIVQTSSSTRGQIYIPQMNLVLAIGTLLLVFTFRSSTAMTHAYGIAVNLVMLLTTVLAAFLAIKKWHWNRALLVLLFTFIGLIDLVFLGANAHKLLTEGWIPILFALVCAFIMYTWYTGRLSLYHTNYKEKEELVKILNRLDYNTPDRLQDTTAIFITDIYDNSGGSFLHYLKLNRSIPEYIIILSYVVDNIPYVPSKDRITLYNLNSNVCEMTLHYGFMDTVSIPKALSLAHHKNLLPFSLNLDKLTYFLEIPNIVASRKKRTLWFFWQEKLFAFLARNSSASLDIEFYQVPFNRTIAIGAYYII